MRSFNPFLGFHTEEVKQTVIVYRYKDLPPRTITLPGEAPSDEEMWEAIRADLAKRRPVRPRRLKLGAE